MVPNVDYFVGSVPEIEVLMHVSMPVSAIPIITSEPLTGVSRVNLLPRSGIGSTKISVTAFNSSLSFNCFGEDMNELRKANFCKLLQ